MDERELSLLDLLRQRAPEGHPREGLRLLHLEVENIFCYRRAELELEEGITVIAGPNGSGKSSLLESIFFALYGSRAAPAMGRSLGEILREGARAGRVRLDFFLSGQRWRSEMGLRRQGDRVISEREGCRLVGEGVEWVGVEEATTKVQELLRMDRDDFVNCVYIRQGEIDRLIRAGEEERRGMIDRLLRLERLDSYATRAKEGARRAINRRLAALEGQATGLKREIAVLEGEGLPQKRAKLEREIKQLEEELAKLEMEWARLEEGRAQVRERLRRLAEAERELEEGMAEREEKRERLKEREGELERLRLLLQGLVAKVDEGRSALSKLLEELKFPREEFFAALKRTAAPEELPFLPQALVEGRGRLEKLQAEAQRQREGLARLEVELGHLRTAAENLDSQVYDLQGELNEEREGLAREEEVVRELRSELERLSAELGCDLGAEGLEGCKQAHLQQVEELQRGKEELQERLVAAQTERAGIAERLAEMEELIRAGRCPTCGQAVTAAAVAGATAELEKEVHRLDKAIEQFQGELLTLDTALATAQRAGESLERLALLTVELRAREGGLKERQERLAQLEERLRRAEEALKENEAALATKERQQRELSGSLEELREKLEEAEQHHALLEKARELAAELLKTLSKLEEEEKRKGELLRAIDELRRDLERLERRLKQLTAERGDRAALEQEKVQIEERMSAIQGERARLQERYGELRDRRGTVTSKLERLERLKGEYQVMAAELEELERLGGEVEQLGELYQKVKGELRKRNIAAINHHFNNLFRLMDSGESYSRALVGEGYEIEVELKDGRGIDPAIMSGGERALINIALRCAIHQVLARAVRAMPLILDEPTVYLDRERIDRLQLLLEELGSRVGQVIVVSHEEGLVEGADHEYRTEKGRDNISTVRRIR